MRVCHEHTAVFDDPNLVSCAGWPPVLTLADRAGLHEHLDPHLMLAGPGAANAAEKATSLVAGMVFGADSIDDMDVLRHGAMARLFGGVRAPSTLGTFLRTFTFGHVRQLDAVAARTLAELAARTPLLAGAAQVAYVDVDDTVTQTYGYAKQGAGYGYSGVKGLNALLATVSTPLAAPVIAACWLRKGSVNSARGASRLLADALVTAKAAGVSGLLIVRADSAFYNHDVLATAIRHGARFSVTARQDPSVRRTIEAIDDTAWTPIHYPNAVWDETEQRLISDAEIAVIAEIEHTAFTSRRTREHLTGRLIVRRVRRLNPTNRHAGAEQGELLPAWRYHAVFTNSPLRMLDAETAPRGHAIIEQVIAELKDGPLGRGVRPQEPRGPRHPGIRRRERHRTARAPRGAPCRVERHLHRAHQRPDVLAAHNPRARHQCLCLSHLRRHHPQRSESLGPSTGTGTMKNRAEPIQLAGDHVLSWRDYSRLRGANGDFRALVLEVG